ncbi:MAG: RidA family protein [bacterium]|nr:RidA family protein [bacterium]
MKTRNYLFVITLMFSVACSPKQMVESKEVYLTEQFGFAQGIVSDGFLFTSGQVGWDKNYQLVGTSFEDQIKQSFTNLEKIVKASGGSFDDVLHIRFYVVDLDEEKRKMVSHCMQKCFSSHYKPASTLLGVQSLAKEDLQIEIEMIAKLNRSKLKN